MLVQYSDLVWQINLLMSCRRMPLSGLSCSPPMSRNKASLCVAFPGMTGYIINLIFLSVKLSFPGNPEKGIHLEKEKIRLPA
jgi:hypothetical protein